ncbi:MAG: S1C family serine protease [Mycoplasmatales bacterium]
MKNKKITISIIIVVSIIFYISILMGVGFFLYNKTALLDKYKKDDDIQEIRSDKSKNPENANYITDIYNQNNDSVISVVNLKEITMRDFFSGKTATQQIEQGSGSGFVYKEENGYYYAITNYHVVEDTDQIQVVLSAVGELEPIVVDAEIIGGSKKEDLVVLKFKTDRKISPVQIGDSDILVPGEPVVAMGSPYGVDFQGSVTDGIISATSRIMENEDGTTSSFIQTDAAINSGNSGGPLFNGDGEVIGVNSRKIADGTTDNMAFAIPINKAMEIVKKIEDLE